MAIDQRDLLIMLETRRRGRAVIAQVSRELNGLDRNHAKVRGGLVALTRAAPLAGAALAVGAARAGTAAVNMAGDFEQAMNVLAETSQANRREMNALSREAIKLGRDVRLPGVSALDAASAMLELSKGGLSVNNTLKATRGTLQLATAGEIAFADAAKLTATTLNAFRLSGTAAGKVADQLAAAASASTAEVSDMAISLSQSAAASHAARQSVGSTVTALSLLAKAGIIGSDAGTSLRVMFQRLTAPTAKAREELSKYGISVFDAQGKVRPLRDLVGQFSDKLGPLADKQRLAALQTIFGTDAMRAANEVLLIGTPRYDAMAKAVGRQGAAADLAGARNKGFKGALDALQSSIETGATTIGLAMLPTLTRWINTLNTEGIPAVERWVKAFRDDLQPHLGRMRQSWNENKGAIVEFLTSLNRSESGMNSSRTAAASLADSIVQLNNALGTGAEKGNQAGNWLDKLADKVTNNDTAVARFGENFRRMVTGWAGMRPPVEKFQDLSTATNSATTAAVRHAGAIRGEKQALDALKGALRSEEAAELDVRQAKINVATAQRRLTDLVKGGRRGSLDYRQAQIDLRRAQLDLKGKTDEYRGAQGRATSATRGAMQAAQRAQGPYKEFGVKALHAGRQAYTMGVNALRGIRLIPSKSVRITATFGFKTPPGVSMHDIVGAQGGLVTAKGIIRRARGGVINEGTTPTADDVLARLSRGEFITNAKATKKHRPLLEAINRDGLPGYATGGPVLDANIASGRVMGRAARRFESAIDRSIRRLAAKWDKAFSFGTLGGAGGPGVGGTVGFAANAWRIFARLFGLPMGGRAPRSNPSDHPFGKAIDVMTSNRMLHRAIIDVFQRLPGAKYWISYRQIGHARDGFRPRYYGGPSPHTDHVHASFFDQGGRLRPGWNRVYNGTGRDEVVKPVGRGDGITVEVNNYGTMIGGPRVADELAQMIVPALVKYKRDRGGILLGIA